MDKFFCRGLRPLPCRSQCHECHGHKADDEILNIDHHRRILILKALNKAKSVKGGAVLLGLSERQTFRWIDRFDIIRIDDTFMTPEQIKSILPQHEHTI